VTKYEFLKFKMAGGRWFKIVFGRNSTADNPISVKFCMGSSFSQNFGNGTDTGVP